MMASITPIVIAAALLSACSTTAHMPSMDSTSAGGTITGGTGGGDSTYTYYYNYNSTTQPGYSESGDLPSQAPGVGVRTAPGSR